MQNYLIIKIYSKKLYGKELQNGCRREANEHDGLAENGKTL